MNNRCGEKKALSMLCRKMHNNLLDFIVFLVIFRPFIPSDRERQESILNLHPLSLLLLQIQGFQREFGKESEITYCFLRKESDDKTIRILKI